MRNEVFRALGKVTLEGDVAQVHFVDSMVTTEASITAILYSKGSSERPFFFSSLHVFFFTKISKAGNINTNTQVSAHTA